MTFTEYITECDRIPVVQTSHAFERAIERGWDEDDLKTFIQNVGYYISSQRHQIEAMGYNAEVFYWDEYYNCGLVAALRRDRYKNQMVIAVITIYPNGSRNPLHPDTRKIEIDKNYNKRDKWGLL